MGTFTGRVGQVYNWNACNLKITKLGTKDNVECKCGVCKATDTYKKSQMKSGELRICKTCKGDIVLGEKIQNSTLTALAYKRGDGVEITADSTPSEDRYSMVVQQPLKLKYICNKCKAIGYYPLNSVVQAMKLGLAIPCSECEAASKEKQAEKEKAKRAKNNSKVGIKLSLPDASHPLLKKSDIISGAIAKESVGETARKIRKPIISDESCTDKKNNLIKVGGLYGDWIVSSIVENTTIESNISKTGKVSYKKGKFINMTCIKCGNTVTIFSDIDDIYKIKCDVCKYTKGTDKEDINILKNVEFKGTVRNGFMVDQVKEKNGVKHVKAHCIYCDKLYKAKKIKKRTTITVPLYYWEFGKEFRCPVCGREEVNVVCPSCGKPHFKIERGRLYDQTKNFREIDKCPNTGASVKYRELALYHNELEDIASCKDIYGDTFDPYEITMSKENVRLMLFKDKYKGTNGLEYKTCMCMRHHKMLSLSQLEINDYDHKYCSNVLMTGYSSNTKGTYNTKKLKH